MVVSSARTTRLGGGAPRSERQSAEHSLPASVQRMTGGGLARGSLLALGDELSIGLVKRKKDIKCFNRLMLAFTTVRGMTALFIGLAAGAGAGGATGRWKLQ